MAKILLIEDNEDDREICRRLLYYNGFDVLIAVNAKTGIAMAISDRPDAILMDVMLPGMNGLIAAQNLARNPATSHIPIICISSYDVVPAQVKHAGARELLVKPLTAESLIRALGRHIGQAEPGAPPQ